MLEQETPVQLSGSEKEGRRGLETGRDLLEMRRASMGEGKERGHIMGVSGKDQNSLHV